MGTTTALKPINIFNIFSSFTTLCKDTVLKISWTRNSTKDTNLISQLHTIIQKSSKVWIYVDKNLGKIVQFLHRWDLLGVTYTDLYSNIQSLY